MVITNFLDIGATLCHEVSANSAFQTGITIPLPLSCPAAFILAVVFMALTKFTIWVPDQIALEGRTVDADIVWARSRPPCRAKLFSRLNKIYIDNRKTNHNHSLPILGVTNK